MIPCTKYWLIIICLILSSNNIFAYDFEADGIRYNIVSKEDRTCEVTTTHELFSLYSGRIVIPEHASFEDNEFTIIGIEGSAFLGSDVTEVVVPETAKYIGRYAFKGCTSMTNVILPESLDSIGACAFIYCWKLKSVTLPRSLKTMEGCIFAECKTLQSVRLPNELTSLGYDFFCNCPELYDIDWPSTLTSIGENTFKGCTSLKELLLPSSLISIGKYAFKGCTGIEKVSYPNSLTSIHSNAFEGCIGIEELLLPSSLKTVESSAFSDCAKLKTISFYDTQFGNKAFSGCVSLRDITAISNIPPVSYYNNTFDDECYKNALLYVPKNTKLEYQSKYIWKNFQNIIEKDFGGVEDVTADGSGICVNVRDRQVEVSGADASEEIRVYDMSGIEIYRGTDRTIALPTKGVYIVKVAGRTFKVAL